jgi:hypothetical protein
VIARLISASVHSPMPFVLLGVMLRDPDLPHLTLGRRPKAVVIGMRNSVGSSHGGIQAENVAYGTDVSRETSGGQCSEVT